MLVYAVYIGKVPLILGFLFPTIIYVRNLVLIRRHEKPDTLAGQPGEGAVRGSPDPPAGG